MKFTTVRGCELFFEEYSYERCIEEFLKHFFDDYQYIDDLEITNCDKEFLKKWLYDLIKGRENLDYEDACKVEYLLTDSGEYQ